VFLLHGCLLISYLLLGASSVIIFWIEDPQNEDFILEGIRSILDLIRLFIELMSFFLVVKLMLPITPSDKQKRSKFQRFLFKGFADINELRAAILQNNHDIDDDQRSMIE
jgi:hypothetical protein